MEQDAIEGSVTVARHDVLASLACVIGCAETLRRWGEQLEPTDRDDLIEIIIRHASDLSDRVRVDPSIPAPRSRV